MLQLNNIYKKYGPSYAVQDLSFKISSGEVVGFLGPNGAGKSTTMRIISGCTGPSEGELLIDAISATPHTRETKRKIGYLPENPPLYPNMTVTDYLLFCASKKGVSNTTSATKHVLSLCSLEEYAHSFISTLSKGYQQRVGLAQALIHKPRLLILDEPTSGLDPEQRIEFRTLIKNLSKGDLTVLLSTHILSEIETICDRVIIIADGSIVAQDTLHNLKSMEQRVRIQTQKDPSELCTQLKNHSKITKVFPLDNYEIEIEYTEEIRTEIASMATPFGLIVLKQATTLEDVYLRLITKTK